MVSETFGTNHETMVFPGKKTLILLLISVSHTTTGFTSITSSAPCSAAVILAASRDDPVEPLVPKTSFGSEAVPEEQRPVNEYLNVLEQPMFDWASNDRGAKGLATRLAIVYTVAYALVCFPIAGASKF